MSDSIIETPSLGVRWCPVCEPDRDPTREILDTAYCGPHFPVRDGSADAGTGDSRHLTATAEADGYDCRMVMALITRSP